MHMHTCSPLHMQVAGLVLSFAASRFQDPFLLACLSMVRSHMPRILQGRGFYHMLKMYMPACWQSSPPHTLQANVLCSSLIFLCFPEESRCSDCSPSTSSIAVNIFPCSWLKQLDCWCRAACYCAPHHLGTFLSAYPPASLTIFSSYVVGPCGHPTFYLKPVLVPSPSVGTRNTKTTFVYVLGQKCSLVLHQE